MERTDIHRPSQIKPEDYREVAVWTMNIQGLGDAEFILHEREAIRRDMERTGGTYAHVETSGSCQVCGNALAIYLVLFHHAPSNTYVKVGINCAAKLGMSLNEEKMNLFRRRVADAREAVAGKKKAIAILSDLGLIAAWDIYTTPFPQHAADCKAAGRNQFGDDNGVENPCTCDRETRAKAYDLFPERTIRDMVGKLVKYGSLSEKQIAFIRSLLKQIDDRPIVEAQRKAEAEAAGPVPTGRVRMQGEVLMVREYDKPRFHYHDSDTVTKVMIRLDNDSKVMGVRFNNVSKGDRVDFVATVEASKDDPKFGFYKRPVLAKSAEEIAAAIAAKKQAAADARFIKTVAWA